MSETEPIPETWVKYSETVDEIWVPSQFHVEIFKKAGISNVHRVPEATDVHLYNPYTTTPLFLPKLNKNNYNFFSVFKWEARKGWDILLQGKFLKIFSIFFGELHFSQLFLNFFLKIF